MWKDCKRVLDRVVKIVGFEIEDFVLIAAMPFIAGVWCEAACAFLWTGVVGATLYLAKRGKPRGYVPHQLHSLQIIKLPGILGPKPERYSPWG